MRKDAAFVWRSAALEPRSRARARCVLNHSLRKRVCFGKRCVTRRAPGLLPEGLPGLSGGGGSWREVDSASARGRHSSPESRPPVLKLSVKLGWLLAENAPKDFFTRVDFASALAARRAGGGPSFGEVAWLFVARFLKWPAAVPRIQVYATIACDAFAERHQSQDVATAAAIMESVARVLQDLSGHPCPTIHARVSSNRRTHSATGIIVACALSRAAPQAWRESGSRGGRSGAELGSGSVAVRVESAPEGRRQARRRLDRHRSRTLAAKVGRGAVCCEQRRHHECGAAFAVYVRRNRRAAA